MLKIYIYERKMADNRNRLNQSYILLNIFFKIIYEN